MSGIGTLFSPHLIEEGALSVLQRWLSLYMEEAKAQYGIELPSIKSWGLEDDKTDRWPEQALPALIVVAEPTQGTEKYSDGWYRANWPFQVVVIIEHPERVMARKIAQIYGAVIRGAILQHRDLGDGGRVAKWVNEALPFEATKSRTEAASQNFFLVQQDEVVNWQMGPKGDEPPETPPPDGPEITETEVHADVGAPPIVTGPPTVNVLDAPYEAVGDGEANDRLAIQRAIDEVSEGGGGTVLLPTGHTFLSGNLILKSGVTLKIEGVLRQSQNPADYSPEPQRGRAIPEAEVSFITYLDQNFPLVYAGEGAEGIAVTGAGSIELTREATDEESVLVHGIGFFKVDGFTISDIEIKRASAYNVTLRDCEHGEVAGIATTEPATLNSDGVSLMNCRHVKVHGNDLTTEDDGVYVWASYEDPRKSEWWDSDTPAASTDIEVYENTIVNEGSTASHGFLFINWTAAATDQSQVEIARINVHDNSFEAPIPIAAIVVDIYHEQNQKTPSKDLTFANNVFTSTIAGPIAEDLDKMATANLSADDPLYDFAVSSNKEGLYNSDFDGHNAFSTEIGASFWSVEGDAGAATEGANHYGQATGDAAIYQGVSLEAGTYTFSAKVKGSGRLIARRASDREVVESVVFEAIGWESQEITFTVAEEGTYHLGILHEGASSGQIDETSIT